MIWVLKGPGPEMAERYALVLPHFGGAKEPVGRNTWEEVCYIQRETELDVHVVYVATSAYHVPRAYLALRAVFARRAHPPVLHVWGTGTVTNLQAQQEAVKLADAQAKGHALKWEDV